MRPRVLAFAVASEVGDFSDEVRQIFAELGRAFGSESLAGECSPVIDVYETDDALEQTLTAENVTPETLKSGAELTLKALETAFGRAQITEINPVGERFDPHRHQAMMTVESREPPNTVVTVYQKGYLINDRTLRPALVAVAKPAEEQDESAPQNSASTGDGSPSGRR